MRKSASSRGVTVAMLLLIAACAPYPRNESEFSSLVATWVSLGQSVDKVKSSLEGRGFTVSRIREGNNPSRPDLFPEALFATQRGELTLCGPNSREWRIVLTIAEERISKIATYVFLHCL